VQDQESSISSTSSRSSSLNDNDIDNSDLNSDDLQFWAEMDCYDKLYNRAKKAAECERQRLELEALEGEDNSTIHSQSDSELSLLASSLFDGMDGIESSQSIQIETSPRRTRLGKVVKYRDD
jgi:hypothetical protein